MPLTILNNTHMHARTIGRIPLDYGSGSQRDLYLTTPNTHNRQTSMPPEGFEPAIPASERPKTHALDTDSSFQPNFRSSSAIEFQMVVILAMLRVFQNRVLRRICGPRIGRGNRGVESTT